MESTIAKYANDLGVNNDYDSMEVLTKFGLSLQSAGAYEQKKLIQKKNFLLQKLVEMEISRKFFFKPSTPFRNPCKVCNGLGELYKFNKKVIDIKCKTCNGQGKKIIDCPICNGTGRFIKRWKSGGGINLKCKKCNGNKTVEIKCLDCQSTGKVKKVVLDSKIKSTTTCTKCEGLGFLPEPKIKKPIYKNPVINNTMAKKLKAVIK